MSRVRVGWQGRRWCALVGCVVGFLGAASTLRAAGADEPLGWRVGPAAWSFNKFTFFEAVDKTASLGLHYIEAFEGQRISKELDEKMGPGLPEPVLEQLRSKLKGSGVTLTSVYLMVLTADKQAARKAFDFCRKLGVETIVAEPPPEAINLLERLCDEYGVKLAIHNHPQGKSRYWQPQEVLKVCAGRSPRLGACADVGHWQRSGIRPVDGVRLLGSRLLSLHVKDLNERGPEGHDVPWGTGKGELAEMLREVHRQGVRPTLFAIEYEYNWDNNVPDIARCAEFFQRTVAEIAAKAAGKGQPLLVGWASVDITPPGPVALVGQLHKRISTGVRDPITATVLALEEGGAGGREQAVMVSCDLVSSPHAIQQRLQQKVQALVPDLDAGKLFINATHTHTAPGLLDDKFKGLYDVSKDAGVMKASEYAEVFLDRVAQAVVQAWQGRKPGELSWAMGQAVVGYNRRAHYANGSTVMYGDTSTPAFASVEAGEDHAVDLLCFWAPGRKLSGLVVNVACPAQETEQLYEVSADFWHDVRTELRRRHGPDLFILPQCAPAGDQSPHLIYRKAAEQIMDQRRWLSRRKEIARRIANAVDEALEATGEAVTDPVFRHTVARVDIPEHQPAASPFYETDPVRPAELHVLRLGDVAIATDPFELYVEYAARIEARSRAALTMLVQLSSGDSGYLPTERAVHGGGYSADKILVGPAGGKVLVDETVKRINELWP